MLGREEVGFLAPNSKRDHQLPFVLNPIKNCIFLVYHAKSKSFAKIPLNFQWLFHTVFSLWLYIIPRYSTCLLGHILCMGMASA